MSKTISVEKSTVGDLIELLREDKSSWWNLADGGDGCICSWFETDVVKIHVHCWKSPCANPCEWAGVHIESAHDNTAELLQLGEIIRNAIDRSDMCIPVVVEGRQTHFNIAIGDNGYWYDQDGAHQPAYEEDDIALARTTFYSTKLESEWLFTKPKGIPYILNDKGFQIPFA